MNRFPAIALAFLILAGGACRSQQGSFTSPTGYSFADPVRYRMPKKLNEISGLAFTRTNNDTLYTESDNDGTVFRFVPGSHWVDETRFAGAGDFEDIAIARDFVIMLRSDGRLYDFPLAELSAPSAAAVRKWDGLVPPGEYEGISADERTGLVHVLCKHCEGERTGKEAGGSVLTLAADGSITATGEFSIDVKAIARLAGVKKLKFHPSALARNPLTGDWWVLSSVNKMLVIVGADWTVKEAIALNPQLFRQPEGLAFDGKGNLYISNEKNDSEYATILKFPLRS